MERNKILQHNSVCYVVKAFASDSLVLRTLATSIMTKCIQFGVWRYIKKGKGREREREKEEKRREK